MNSQMNFGMPGLRELRTPNLLLRWMLPPDANEYHALMNELRDDLDTRKFLNLDNPILTIDMYAKSLGRTQGTNRCTYRVSQLSTDQFIGICGFLSRKGFKAPELFVWLTKSARGSGFGPEAANELIAQSFKTNLCDQVIAIPHTENTPSIKATPKMKLKHCANVLLQQDPFENFAIGREYRFPIFCRQRDDSILSPLATDDP